MEVVRVFNKSEYAGPPDEHIREMLDKLVVLGKAVIACRGDGFSANISGTVHIGEDGGDPVLRGKPVPLGECDCHVHTRWNEVIDYALAEEDVGYGPEPVIYLLGADEKPIVRMFYPRRTFDEVYAVLESAEPQRVVPVSRPFRFVFMISFPSEDKLGLYVTFWNDISRVIQREPGARGTRLHRVNGSEPAILAVAEWESAEARLAASQKLNAQMQIDAVVRPLSYFHELGDNRNMRENEDFSEKKVLVMGLGLHGGGAGAVEFFARRGAEVTVTDLRTRRELAPTLRALAHLKGVRYVLGRHRAEDFRTADSIVKNPGVRRDSPYLKEAIRRGIPITSDIGIFFDLCPGRIIGVTGTRGKSTTTYLIWKLLKTKFGSRVHYGGNIRKSVLLLLPKVKKDDIVVLELSSFQLMDLTIEKKSPPVAVLTNIMRDHLNWHRSMREYVQAKSEIFRYQHPRDVLFIPASDAALRRFVRAAPGRISEAKLPASLLKAVDRNLGVHYRFSVALAVGVARHFGVTPAAIKQTIARFKGLESRQEMIGSVHGVHFVNDTTATIPDAAIAAIQRFRKRAGSAHQLILIAGGQDKKLDFRVMLKEIKKSVDVLIFLPGSATEHMTQELRIMKQESRGVLVETASSMKQAVHMAYGMARKDDYVLLSPGAASFGLFLNEFDRGAQFVRAVAALRKKNR